MKKLILVAILLFVLVSSFVVGILVSPVSAAKCTTSCDYCTCHKFRCCDGICTDLGPCGFRCPLIPC